MRKTKKDSHGFKEWLRINEISNISHIDTASVKLTPTSAGYEYRFYFPSPEDPGAPPQEFSVGMFGGKAKEYMGIPLPMQVSSYSITFSGPDGYSLTGRSGAQAVAIYSKLLSAIKKLMETEHVDALSFSAFDEKMIPMYDRFLKTLLPDFTQVDDSTYVRTSLLDAVLKHLPDEKREELMGRISQSQRDKQDAIRRIKAQKVGLRSAKNPFQNDQTGKSSRVSQTGAPDLDSTT